MTPTLKGTLRFISFFEPILIKEADGFEYDLLPKYFKFFSDYNGKRITDNQQRAMMEIRADENSEWELEFKADKDTVLIWRNQVGGLKGGSNIHAYLSMTMQELNGRSIMVTVNDTGIKIEADPAEKVFGVYYTGEGNSCAVEDEDALRICKPRTADCCVFLALSADGFECRKFDSYMARNILDRVGKKQMNATRIGNCEVLGRKETQK